MKWILMTEEGPFPPMREVDSFDFLIDAVLSELVLCYTSKKSYLLLSYDYTKSAWVLLNGEKIIYTRCHIEYWASLTPPKETE